MDRDDLEARQAEMKARVEVPTKEKKRLQVLRWRHRNVEHVREQASRSAHAARFKPHLSRVVRILRDAILAGRFRDLTAIEKIQIRVAAAKKERERREAPMSVEVAASLFDLNPKSFVTLMVFPGVHGSLRVVSERGAPRMFRTADVEDLWEKISETRPDFFYDLRHRPKPKVRKTRARKAFRFSESVE